MPLDGHPPSANDVVIALQQLKNGKATVWDLARDAEGSEGMSRFCGLAC